MNENEIAENHLILAQTWLVQLEQVVKEFWWEAVSQERPQIIHSSGGGIRTP